MEDCSPLPLDFDTWADNVIAFYKSLSNDHKNNLLDRLIAISQPRQWSFLSTRLPGLLSRDFISHLPLELIPVILKYLDGKQILLCCQVCKSWRSRIDSLTTFWRTRALQVGVDVQVVTLNVKGHDLAKIYKVNCLQAEKFLADLRKHGLCMKRVKLKPGSVISTFCVGDEYLFTGHRETICMWSLHNWELQTEFELFPFQLLRSNISCDHSNLSVHYSNAIITSWSFLGDIRRHSYRGHTAWIRSIDVTKDNRYAVTGALDNSIKLWDKSGGTEAELIMTLDSALSNKFLKVQFLPHCKDEQLVFISCDVQCFTLWSVNVQTRHVDSRYEVSMEVGLEIESCSLDLINNGTVFISLWNFQHKSSSLTSYQVRDGTVANLSQTWELSKKGVKAFLLGVGSRFAFFMCSISRHEFHLFDLKTACCVASFTSPDYRFVSVKEEKKLIPPVKLCARSWLDGFVFDQMRDEKVVLVALDDTTSLVSGTWNISDLSDQDIVKES